MAEQHIKIRGTDERNLKDISVDMPRNGPVVPTGLSGPGKPPLAFDTIYAEGQRRRMEPLSSYTRQFLGQIGKSDVESIEGLSPAISIDQKFANRNPRSTVGMVMEVYNYMRPLYARIGIPYCPKYGKEIYRQTIDQMVNQIMSMSKRTKIQLLVPAVKGRKGEHVKVLGQARKSGYVRTRIDGNLYELSEEIRLEKNIKHNIETVVDRLTVKEGIERRFTDSIETVMALNGRLMVMDVGGGEPMNFSQSFSCPDCAISIGEVGSRSFLFNNPFGAYPECFGLGYEMEPDEDLMIPDKSLSMGQGATVVTGWQSCANKDNFTKATLEVPSETYDFRLDMPFQDYPKEIRDALLCGTEGWEVGIRHKNQRGKSVYDVTSEGLTENVNRRCKEASSKTSKAEHRTYMRIAPYPVCKGQRLKKESLVVTVGRINTYEAINMFIVRFKEFMDGLKLTLMQETIGASTLKGIRARICLLIDAGLGYLSLSQAIGALSGGEAQCARLAAQIDSNLVGAAYILGEPSIGLCQRDNDKFFKTLTHLRDLDNNILVVEHDEDTMRAAGCIVDIGPDTGEHGGGVIAMGTAEEITKNPDSITGAYLSGRVKVSVPAERREPTSWITVKGAAENNLENFSVGIPLGIMTCVTGVSGSGKSSFVNEAVYRSLARKLNRARTIPGRHRSIGDVEQLDKIVDIDQSPIRRTPRSNPAIYIDISDLIRDLFASIPDAKAKGYNKRRSSPNVKGGRCEACNEDSTIKIGMYFLSDVCMPCEVCSSKRHNCETLNVKYKGKNIYDVLDMITGKALKLFENASSATRKIQTLYDIGLGYIRLGQPFTELSGGEAQRVGLAAELSKRGTGKAIYILDESITGFHFADVHKLTDILHRLSGGGDAAVTAEHDLDVVKTADYIVDIGPEGGNKNGTVITKGTPEEVARCPIPYTGMYIKEHLD